jgi:Flp pilus assembly pilin Flp
LLDESGQDLIEYVLLVFMAALAVTAGMGTVANSLNTAYTNLAAQADTNLGNTSGTAATAANSGNGNNGTGQGNNGNNNNGNGTGNGKGNNGNGQGTGGGKNH